MTYRVISHMHPTLQGIAGNARLLRASITSPSGLPTPKNLRSERNAIASASLETVAGLGKSAADLCTVEDSVVESACADAAHISLHEDHVRALQRDGYVVVPDFLPPAFVCALLARPHRFQSSASYPCVAAFGSEQRPLISHEQASDHTEHC